MNLHTNHYQLALDGEQVVYRYDVDVVLYEGRGDAKKSVSLLDGDKDE